MKVTHLIFKYLFLFTLLLGIVGCEKEEANQPEINQTTNSGKSSMTRVDVKDIPSLDQFVQSKMYGFQKSQFNSMASIVTPLGIVPMEDVLQVIDGEGNTNYSFRIVPEDLTSLSVYNLIIHQGPDGEEPIAYIMEYIREYDDNGNLNPYAKVRKYPYELIQKSISAKVGCGDDGGTSDEPCLELVLDTSESDTSSNNNTSSGGGDGSNDGIIATPVGPITESTTNVVITITGDTNTNTTDDPDIQVNSPDGCYVVDEVFYDANNNIVVTYIWVDDCPYKTDDKSLSTKDFSKISGCDSGSGDVAIDLMGLTLNDLNLLSSTLGLNSVLWLNQNCELDSLVNQMFARTQKTAADAQLMASLVNFWKATEGNQDAFILSLDIITARERGEIGIGQASKFFKIMLDNDHSLESISFVLDYKNILTTGNPSERLYFSNLLSGNTNFNYGSYFNANASFEEGPLADFSCPYPPCYDGLEPSMEMLWAAGPGLIQSFTDAGWNLFIRFHEWNVPDVLEGQVIRRVMRLRGIEVPSDIEDDTLGELFQAYSENGKFKVRIDQGLGADILEMGLHILDVVTIMSPSRGGGAFLAINGGEKVTVITFRQYLNHLKELYHKPIGAMLGKTIGHTFKKHGSHNTIQLKNLAKNGRNHEGQWLNDIAAEDFILRHLNQLSNGVRDIPIPASIQNIGRVFRNGDGAVFVPTHIRLVPSGSGVKTAYPINHNLEPLETLGVYVP